MELLIHVGIDTVNMEGEGFHPLVKPGDRVKCGQTIMTFSISGIEAAGYASTTAIIVTNSQEFANVEVIMQGAGKKSKKICRFHKKIVLIERRLQREKIISQSR
jgi:sugar PTS system EIIA component